MRHLNVLFLGVTLSVLSVQADPAEHGSVEWCGDERNDAAEQQAQPIPWAQLGAKAGAQYSGDGLSVLGKRPLSVCP